MNDLPREILEIIVTKLGPWDSLQLRQTNKRLFDIVTKYQPYWYRQFCWYLILQKKRPAMYKTGCARTHTRSRTIDCLDTQQEMDLAHQLGVPFSALGEMVMENPSIMDAYVCTNYSHYIYDLPRNRFDIKLDENDYKPSSQVYCYRFLIHNYRQQRQRVAKWDITSIEDQRKEIRLEIRKKQREFGKVADEHRRDMQRIRNRDEYLKSVADQIKRLDNNRVFHGQRSRTYRSTTTTPQKLKKEKKNN